MKFEFGKNWTEFATSALNPDRVDQARRHFDDWFEGLKLEGKSFLDIGFGQGLSLHLAQASGAHAFGIDVDEDNVRAIRRTNALFEGGKLPRIEIASILDPEFVEQQEKEGGFDIVHSWGVLHHTGEMYRAIDHAIRLVKPGGFFVLAIYNRHWSSLPWLKIKWLYNISPAPVKKVMIYLFYPVIYLAKTLVTGKNPVIKERGMDFYYDVVDWVGGYPYEYASVEEIGSYLGEREFELVRVREAEVPTGCNEFVFRRNDSE